MPELPEVECIRRGLQALAVGRVIHRFEVRRDDFVRGERSLVEHFSGATLSATHRHGKQIALETSGAHFSPCFCMHLGMSGSVRFTPGITPGITPEVTPGITPEIGAGTSSDTAPETATGPSLGRFLRTGPSFDDPHVHAVLHFEDGSKLEFRDPRRFGGIWVYPRMDVLRQERWQALGPDAMHITTRQLHDRLAQTKRAIKAALLDQAIIAGLGNIYVDEALFVAAVHPLVASNRLSRENVRRLVKAVRLVLNRAIDSGGSTLRDYVAVTGLAGDYQHFHQVYGRAGQPCLKCGRPLASLKVAGRTTVVCAHCQKFRHRLRRS